MYVANTVRLNNIALDQQNKCGTWNRHDCLDQIATLWFSDNSTTAVAYKSWITVHVSSQL